MIHSCCFRSWLRADDSGVVHDIQRLLRGEARSDDERVTNVNWLGHHVLSDLYPENDGSVRIPGLYGGAGGGEQSHVGGHDGDASGRVAFATGPG